jgi:hypothetical protein
MSCVVGYAFLGCVVGLVSCIGLTCVVVFRYVHFAFLRICTASLRILIKKLLHRKDKTQLMNIIQLY